MCECDLKRRDLFKTQPFPEAGTRRIFCGHHRKQPNTLVLVAFSKISYGIKPQSYLRPVNKASGLSRPCGAILPLTFCYTLRILT